MKKIAVIFIAFSVTLYGCIFDIGFDKDQHRRRTTRNSDLRSNYRV